MVRAAAAEQAKHYVSRHHWRHLVQAGVTAMLAFLVGCVLAPRANAYASRIGGDFAGINAQYVLGSVPSSDWDAQFAAMAAAGIRDVRGDMPWGLVEPNPPINGQHTYLLWAGDPAVAALARHGLRWYPVIDYSTLWDAGEPGNYFSPPKAISDYAAYARALVQRWGPNGTFWKANPQLPYLPVTTWEIWNEENSKNAWGPAPNAAQYTDLYLAARAAIKSVDPNATVVVGGLVAGTADEFITQMFASHPGLAREVDAFGLHPYERNAADTLAAIASFRRTLMAAGDPSVPIQITEFGWGNASSWLWPTSEADSAAYFRMVTNEVATSNCNVTRFMPFAWTDTNSDGGFRLFNTDGTPLPPGAAYSNAILNLEGQGAQPPPRGTTRLCPAATNASEANASAIARGAATATRAHRPKRPRKHPKAHRPTGRKLRVRRPRRMHQPHK